MICVKPPSGRARHESKVEPMLLFVVVTWTHDPASRRRSYELLAEAFHLRTD